MYIYEMQVQWRGVPWHGANGEQQCRGLPGRYGVSMDSRVHHKSKSRRFTLVETLVLVVYLYDVFPPAVAILCYAVC